MFIYVLYYEWEFLFYKNIFVIIDIYLDYMFLVLCGGLFSYEFCL